MRHFLHTSFYLVPLFACIFNTNSFAAEPAKPAADFFEKEVQPILQAHCFSCHGAEKKVKGGLDMSSREALLKGSDNGAVVSLEKPDTSMMIDAIRHGELKMPPKGKLPLSQIEILEKWIKSGVPYSGGKGVAKQHGPPKVDAEARNFWSYKAVKNPTIPKVKNQAWVKNPIDAFILSKLEQNQLTPALPAEKTALLRRLYFNLIGLPPSIEETESFLKDTSPDAYEKRVDLLLNSRHYGENWARHWLDLVRYAETNSFERDGTKPNAWKYRDYVIQSFNSDKPYNQFIKEQLAGDEIEKVSRDSLVATAYYRLGIWDDEPADRELAYFDQLDDIVSTTGQTFLGTTIGCARCHDHKIDPFPQKDYYRFMAFFHGINSYGNGPASQRVVDGDTQDLKGVISTGRRPDLKKLQDLEIKAQEHERASNDVNRQIGRIEDDFRAKLPGGQNDDFKQDTSTKQGNTILEIIK
jgi:mono/diheme cytochrome c family protein